MRQVWRCSRAGVGINVRFGPATSAAAAAAAARAGAAQAGRPVSGAGEWLVLRSVPLAWVCTCVLLAFKHACSDLGRYVLIVFWDAQSAGSTGTHICYSIPKLSTCRQAGCGSLLHGFPRKTQARSSTLAPPPLHSSSAAGWAVSTRSWWRHSISMKPSPFHS